MSGDVLDDDRPGPVATALFTAFMVGLVATILWLKRDTVDWGSLWWGAVLVATGAVGMWLVVDARLDNMRARLVRHSANAARWKAIARSRQLDVERLTVANQLLHRQVDDLTGMEHKGGAA